MHNAECRVGERLATLAVAGSLVDAGCSTGGTGGFDSASLLQDALRIVFIVVGRAVATIAWRVDYRPGGVLR